MLTVNIKTFFIVLLSAIAVISLILNGFLVYKIIENVKIYQQNMVNSKVLTFRNLFSEKILLAEGDVDFDTRITLETAVRTLNDSQILGQWQTFTKAETKEQATREAKTLLRLLIQKTAY